MTISVQGFHNGGSFAAQSGYFTSSITPPANELLVCVVQNRDSDFVGELPVLSGWGLTWTRQFTSQSAQGHRVSVLTTPGGPVTTGQGFFDFGGVDVQDECSWQFMVCYGGRLRTPVNGLASSGSTTTYGLAVNPLESADSILIGGVAHAALELTTPGTGYTEVNDQFNEQVALQTQWKANDQNFGGSWATSTFYAAACIEIAAKSQGVGLPIF